MPTAAIEQYEGQPFKVGPRTYIIPALSFGAAKRMRADIRKIGAGELPPEEAQDLVAKVVFAALVRNYPNLTLEQVEDEIVDYENWGRLFDVVMRTSLFTKDGAVDVGNAPAGSPLT